MIVRTSVIRHLGLIAVVVNMFVPNGIESRVTWLEPPIHLLICCLCLPTQFIIIAQIEG